METFLGLTWVGWLNFLFLQWLWIRLYWYRDTPQGKPLGYGLKLGIMPLTGWWTPYWPKGKTYRLVEMKGRSW